MSDAGEMAGKLLRATRDGADNCQRMDGAVSPCVLAKGHAGNCAIRVELLDTQMRIDLRERLSDARIQRAVLSERHNIAAWMRRRAEYCRANGADHLADALDGHADPIESGEYVRIESGEYLR